MEYIVPILLGVLIVVIGIRNVQGHIKSIHRYHRMRVSEEDKPAFARCMGLGTICVGVGVFIFGVFALISEWTGIATMLTIGTVFLIVCLIPGVGFSLYAMIKYNKGIF